MDVSRINFPGNLGTGFAIIAGLGASFGSAFQAQAQVDPNAQSRVQSYTIPLTPGFSETQLGSITAGGVVPPPEINSKLSENNIGACLDDPTLLVVLFTYNENDKRHTPESYLTEQYHWLAKISQSATLEGVFDHLNHHKEVASEILSHFFRSNRETGKQFALEAVDYCINPGRPKSYQHGEKTARPLVAQQFPISFCAAKPAIKVIAPFNPTDETNVLKSNQNNSPGNSVGYGGTLQAFVPVPDPAHKFDVVGFSAQSQSVRYTQFRPRASIPSRRRPLTSFLWVRSDSSRAAIESQ